MNLIELSELLLDEKKAEEYLLKVGILKTFTECGKCGGTRVNKISRGRYMCRGCKSEWPYRKHSILHGQSLSASKLLGLIKMYEIELTAMSAEKELGINERTAQRVFEMIRNAIIGENAIASEKVIRDLTPNFAISIVDGVVDISIDTGNTFTNLFKLKRTRVPSKETSYNFHYTNVKPNEIEKCLNQLPLEQNYFWRFAKIRLLSYRGTKMGYLFNYLKEIEFRYNNRNEKLFDKIVDKIVCYKGW